MMNMQPVDIGQERFNVRLRTILTGLRGVVVVSSYGAIFLAGYAAAVVMGIAAAHDVAEVDYKVDDQSPQLRIVPDVI